MILFYYIVISKLSISGFRGSLGLLGLSHGLQILFWAPVAKVILFYYTPISNLSISGSWGYLGLFGRPDGTQIRFWAHLLTIPFEFQTVAKEAVA